MINVLVVLFAVTMLYLSLTSRLHAYIKVLSIQGFLLFFMVLTEYGKLGMVEFVFLIVETVLFKAIAIPLILSGVVKRNNISRSVEPYITNFSSVVIASLIFVFGFVISYWSISISEELQHLAFGISVSTIMIGLFVIISRKKIITHIMGYMILENGIFLLTLSTSKEMPLMVSLGILLDIFIAIYILVVFFARIKSTFEETHIDDLTNLKD